MFQATNIIPEQEIFKSLSEIQTYLEAHYDSDNPSACVSRGTDLSNYLALSAKLIADAKYWQEQVQNSVITDTIKEALRDGGWSAQAINKKIEALLKDQNYLVLWSQRVNAACTHQLEFLRTVISKLKEEMKQYGGR